MTTRVGGWFRRKARERWGGIFATPQSEGYPNRDYANYVKQGLRGNPYVGAAIRLIAQNASRVPLVAYRQRGDNRIDLEPTHGLMRVLHRPNEAYGATMFWQRTYQHLLLSGDAYCRGAMTRAQRPWTTERMELFNVQPHWVTPMPKPKAGIEYYKVRPPDQPESKAETVPPDEMLHLWFADPMRDYDGLAPTASAWSAIQQSNAASAWNFNVQRRAGRPGLIWEWQGDEQMTDEQFEEVSKRIEEKYGGYMNAGRDIIADGFTAKPIGLSPHDAEWIEGIKLTMRQIGVTWFVPTVLLGDHENATYSNLQTAIRLLYELNIFPMLDWVTDELTHWIQPKYGEDIVVDYARDEVDVLQEERAQVIERNVRAVQAGIKTPNEAREELGLERVEGGDDLWISATMMPLSAMEIEHPADVGEGKDAGL